MFKKEDLDLVLDKRDEMISLAGNNEVPIHNAYGSFITCVTNEQELMEISKLLDVQELKKVDWENDEDYLYKISFVYRGHEFYHLKERSREN